MIYFGGFLCQKNSSVSKEDKVKACKYYQTGQNAKRSEDLVLVTNAHVILLKQLKKFKRLLKASIINMTALNLLKKNSKKLLFPSIFQDNYSKY